MWRITLILNVGVDVIDPLLDVGELSGSLIRSLLGMISIRLTRLTSEMTV